MDVSPFRIERFYARYEHSTRYMLSSSDSESRTIAELVFLLYHAILRPGDHAIVETPCYESALQLARSTGAEVSQWRRRYEDGWAHDVDALAGLIRPATRLIYLNQPHNPTGTLMARPVFEQVIGLAREHGLVVFSDEVYRELEHDAGQSAAGGVR